MSDRRSAKGGRASTVRAPSVRSGASRGGKSMGGKSAGRERPVVVDKRFETSRAVLLGLEAAIRAQGGAAVGAEIPASLYFVAITAALRSDDRSNVEEVRCYRWRRGVACGWEALC